MGWKKGPLPPNTWGWGGVVPVGEEKYTGFYFADFCGDHVRTFTGKLGEAEGRVLKADEVAFWCNCLQLPIVVDGAEGVKGRAE